jgi:7,8-dihydropterin-6-yl-methyl-4-(beta-D-ribofuranosyl)aminobenzene 5'-phosphate synthase
MSHELDQLDIVVVTDNETDGLSSAANGVQTSELASAVLRHPAGELAGHACTTVFDQLCCACHGFSALLTGRRGDETHTVLFDVGPYGDVWLDNAERLGVDLSAIEAVFLSHWHWDHSGGLIAAIEQIAAARRALGHAPPVLSLHPQRPDRRGTQLPNGHLVLLPADPTFAELTAAGAEIVLHLDGHDLAGGFFHGSGEIPRLTSFETGLVNHVTIDGDEVVADPLIMDERYLSAVVRGRGVTVLSACSHAGIVNAAHAGLADSSADRIDMLLGGYHLAGAPMEPRIPDTVAALARLEPRLVAPGHCTGWRAKAALAGRFEASGQYGPSVVGTRYRLVAE